MMCSFTYKTIAIESEHDPTIIQQDLNRHASGMGQCYPTKCKIIRISIDIKRDLAIAIVCSY